MILWPLHFGWLLVLGLYKEEYLQVFKCVSFKLHSFCSLWEYWDPVNRFNQTSLVAVATPADRPMSVCNRWEIELWVAFCVVTLLFEFTMGVMAFVIGLTQIFSFLLLT